VEEGIEVEEGIDAEEVKVEMGEVTVSSLCQTSFDLETREEACLHSTASGQSHVEITELNLNPVGQLSVVGIPL